MKPDQDKDLEAIRQLREGRFQGVLSTQSLAEPGYPFGSLVPYCLDRTGLPIFLLSHLAQHCKNLDADPRCALTVAEPVAGDVQQSLRLTCVGDCSRAAPEDTQNARRYFRYFPQGRTYFDELNFRLYRLTPRRFHYNGGFGTARWLGTDRILRPTTLDATREGRLIEHIERNDLSVLRTLAGDASAQGQPRIAGIDLHGLDLGMGERLTRIPFARRLDTPENVHAYLRGIA